MSLKEIQISLFRNYKMLKVYENLSDLQFLKGNYTQSEYFHKRAFQTIKESESFLELLSGTPQDLYHLQNSIKRIKSYIEV
jgi:hypothetical protein